MTNFILFSGKIISLGWRQGLTFFFSACLHTHIYTDIEKLIEKLQLEGTS